MMFKKPMIITLFKSTLRILSGDKVKEFTWNSKNLVQVVGVIMHTYQPKRVRVILGEDMAYVYSFFVDRDKLSQHEVIVQLIESHLPDMVINLVWDYQVSSDFTLEKSGKVFSVVQVSAVEKSIALILVDAFKQNNVNFEMIEPISITLARLLVKEPDPIFVIYIDQESTLSVVYRGLVIVTELLNTESLTKQMMRLKTYVFNNFGIKLVTCMVNDRVNSSFLEKIDKLGVTVKKQEFNLEQSMLTVHDLTNLGSGETRQPLSDRQSWQVLTAVPMKLVAVWMLILLIIGAVGFGAVQFVTALNLRRGYSVEIASTASPELRMDSSTPPTTPAAEIMPVDKAELAVSVLNGSGVSGRAAAIETSLKSIGFNKVTTGNADTYSYQGVTISYDGSEPLKPVIEELKTLFSKDYEVKVDAVIGSSEYAIVIVVGR